MSSSNGHSKIHKFFQEFNTQELPEAPQKLLFGQTKQKNLGIIRKCMAQQMVMAHPNLPSALDIAGACVVTGVENGGAAAVGPSNEASTSSPPAAIARSFRNLPWKA